MSVGLELEPYVVNFRSFSLTIQPPCMRTFSKCMKFAGFSLMESPFNYS